MACDFLPPPSLHVFSSNGTTHRATNGSISRFQFGVVAPSYPFQHAFWWDIWGPLCSNFILFWPRGKCLVYNSTNLSNLLIIFPNFLHNTLYATWITSSFNCKYPLMCVHTLHRPYGYPLLMLSSWQRMHWNPCAIYDTFAASAWDVGFHVGQEQLYVLLSTTLNSSYQRVDIVLTKNDIHTLTDVVIANPTQADLLP
jgi:hypothetical protein